MNDLISETKKYWDKAYRF